MHCFQKNKITNFTQKLTIISAQYFLFFSFRQFINYFLIALFLWSFVNNDSKEQFFVHVAAHKTSSAFINYWVPLWKAPRVKQPLTEEGSIHSLSAQVHPGLAFVPVPFPVSAAEPPPQTSHHRILDVNSNDTVAKLTFSQSHLWYLRFMSTPPYTN